MAFSLKNSVDRFVLLLKTGSRQQLWVHLGIMGCVSLVLFLGFFFVWLPASTHHGESVTVPDLTGRKVENLEVFLEKHDLRYEISDSNYVQGKVPLSVLSQYPKSGAKVKTNRKIFLTIASQNPPMVKMPKLTQLSPRSAESLLKSFDLQPDAPEYVSDLSESVLKQFYNDKPIEPGSNIPKGAKVKLVIGDGKKVVRFVLENGVGKTREEASQLLKGQHLQVNVYPEYAQNKPLGTVVRQNPAPGSEVKAGDAISLWVISKREILKPDTLKTLPDSAALKKP